MPERPLWGEDGLEAPDTVSGRAEQNGLWGTRLEQFFGPARFKFLWGRFEGRSYDVLRTPYHFVSGRAIFSISHGIIIRMVIAAMCPCS
jgi:hypothetical protein